MTFLRRSDALGLNITDASNKGDIKIVKIEPGMLPRHFAAVPAASTFSMHLPALSGANDLDLRAS